MKPVKTGQIPNTNIYAIKDFIVNVYLIKTDTGYIMIDAGLNAQKIKNSIEEAGINISDVKWIFLTHSDGDHTAALALFPNAVIHMSKNEFPLINGTMKRTFWRGNSLPSGVNIDKIVPLSNGQVLSFDGIKVECILAQGHTIGSMMYLVDATYLFTGDVFKIKNGKTLVHPFTMDVNLSKKTIEKLRETVKKSHLVLTSHYGIHNNN